MKRSVSITMKLIALTVFVTYVTASPHSLVEDEDGQQYQLVPLRRFRRQNRKTSFDLYSPGIATLNHKGIFVDNKNHRLEGSGYVSKDFSKSGAGGLRPDNYGGRLDYMHKPTRLDLGLSADHARHAGTDVKASGTWNFVQTKKADVGLTGEYGRHFGQGGSRPNYGVSLNGNIRF